MAFSSDFCVATPAHGSISSYCPPDVNTTIVDQREAVALGRANYINGIIGDLAAYADGIGDSALAIVGNLLNYKPPPLPTVTYKAPSWTSPAAKSVNAGSIQTNPADVAPDFDAWEKPVFNEVDLPGADLVAPETELPVMPTVPSLDTPPTLPTAPGEYDPAIEGAPIMELPELVLGDASAPLLQDIDIVIPDLIDLEGLELTIDYTPIEEAIERLNNITPGVREIPDYEQLIPEVFTVVGGMLSGYAVNEDRIRMDAAKARNVAPSLRRRGLNVPDAVIAYDTWFSQYVAEYAGDSATLFAATYRDDVIKSAYALATEAEKVMLDIDLGMYDARFRYAMEWAKASLEIAKGIVSAYNAQVLEYQALATEYNASLVQLRAQAQLIGAQADMIKIVGQTNKLLAREFTIEEQAKATEVKVLRSQVKAEAAKLDAFKAEVSAYEANVAKARAGMLAYTAQVEEYTANVQGAQNQYELFSAEARAVVEQNQAVVAEVRGSTADLRAIANEATARAEEAGVEAARKMRESKSDTAEQVDASMRNEAERYKIADTLGRYAEQIAELRANTASDEVAPAMTADIGNAISRFVTTAIESSGRAAQMAQSANESLAKAYARAYETAGKAGAQIASGKQSGFRASASIQAVGDMTARSSVTTSEAGQGKLHYGESDRYTKSVTGT